MFWIYSLDWYKFRNWCPINWFWRRALRSTWPFKAKNSFSAASCRTDTWLSAFWMWTLLHRQQRSRSREWLSIWHRFSSMLKTLFSRTVPESDTWYFIYIHFSCGIRYIYNFNQRIVFIYPDQYYLYFLRWIWWSTATRCQLLKFSLDCLQK